MLYLDGIFQNNIKLIFDKYTCFAAFQFLCSNLLVKSIGCGFKKIDISPNFIHSAVVCIYLLNLNLCNKILLYTYCLYLLGRRWRCRMCS